MFHKKKLLHFSKSAEFLHLKETNTETKRKLQDMLGMLRKHEGHKRKNEGHKMKLEVHKNEISNFWKNAINKSQVFLLKIVSKIATKQSRKGGTPQGPQN